MAIISDTPLQRILSAPNWRARFFEAAANASASLVEYSLRHQDAINADLWMDRFRFFREKAKISGKPGTALQSL
jgi:hypothetical protein